VARIIKSEIEELHSREKLTWVYESLNKDKVEEIENEVENGKYYVFCGEGVKNLNFFSNIKKSLNFRKENIEYGSVIPLCFKKELFNSFNIYPLYLKEDTNYTPGYILDNYINKRYKTIATGYNGNTSLPIINLFEFKKGGILSLGLILNQKDKNIWSSHFEVFKRNLENFIFEESYKNKKKFWKYYIPDFESISFLYEKKLNLKLNKKLFTREIKRKTKNFCKNEKIYFDYNQKIGRIITPPIEGAHDIKFSYGDKLKCKQYAKIIDCNSEYNSGKVVIFPHTQKTTIYFYVETQKNMKFNLSYNLHFKMLSPFPDFFYSKVNYSINEKNRRLIAHSSDNTCFFINRSNLVPSEIKIKKERGKTPKLNVNLDFDIDKNNFLLIQFSLIHSWNYLKKSDIKKLLHSFKRKVEKQALKQSARGVLKIIQGKKRIDFKKRAIKILENIYRIDDEENLKFINIKKKITQTELINKLIDLILFGYSNKVKNIIKNYKQYKRLPYVIYPSGATIYDYREKSLNKLKKVGICLKEFCSDNFNSESMTGILGKKIDFFNELNFKGVKYWNKLLGNPETLYYNILNPLLTESSIIFVPVIPFFIKNFKAKNIKIAKYNFDFFYRLKNNKVFLRFKNKTGESIAIDFYPLFKNKISKKRITIKKNKRVEIKIDKNILMYCSSFCFSDTPTINKKDDRVKISFSKLQDINKLIQLEVELFGKTIKKIVGARVLNLNNNNERILLCNPSKNKRIYLYLKSEIRKEKHLFKLKE